MKNQIVPARPAIFIGLVICLATAVSAFAQSLPNLSVNLNTNGKVHLTWTVPALSSILQEATSLNGSNAWQASSANVSTNGCNCNAIISPSSPAKLRIGICFLAAARTERCAGKY